MVNKLKINYFKIFFYFDDLGENCGLMKVRRKRPVDAVILEHSCLQGCRERSMFFF